MTAKDIEIGGIENDRRRRTDPVAAFPPEQPVERHVGEPRREVPQRHVDRAQGKGDDAAVAAPVGQFAELGPDRLDVAGVAAKKPWRETAVDDHLHRQRGVFAAGDRLAPADRAAGSLDPHQRDATDLAVVVGLGIAKRQRLDPRDLLLGHRHSSPPTRIVRPSRAALYIASTNSTVSTPSAADDPLTPRPSTTSTRLSAGAQSG